MEKEKRDRAAELVSRAASERILASGTDSDEKAPEMIAECALHTETAFPHISSICTRSLSRWFPMSRRTHPKPLARADILSFPNSS
nr:hypothetical protein [Bacillota bacterium]